MMPRFLRSKRERALLWYAQDGRCALCGEALPEQWHADHTVAWWHTRRTNVHEMGATCPRCNLQKGGKMQEAWSMHSGMNLHAYRPGQYSGHMVVYERVQAREPYTCIVLPTRYGKTDVMRATSIHLWRDDLISASIVLSPGVFLRDQVTNLRHWDKFIQRYQVDMEKIKYRSLAAEQYLPQVNFAANGEILISTSMQLVNNYVDFFQRWIASRRAQTGLPVLVNIDEAHTGSEDNSWGNTVQRLVQAGALAVLYTATPFRSDGKKIPGFPYKELDATPTFHYTGTQTDDPNMILVSKFEAMDRTWRLVAHHETTFREGWDESTMANVSRVPFDVDLEQINMEGGLEREMLSALSEGKARRILEQLCRHPRVMREGVTRFVEQLRLMKQLDPACAGIIFCGNDQRGPDRVTNEHAKQLQDLIREQAQWEVVIATSANPDDEAEQRIKRFADEITPGGDVLIVKQMAGCGIDVPRLKVILDLSSTRAEAAWIQRVMRAATLYKGLPAVYIAPDDCMSRALFDRLVAAQGGAVSQREVGDLLLTYEKEREARAQMGLYVAATDNADFQDNLGREGERGNYDLVQLLCREFPNFLETTTHAGLAEKIQLNGFKVLTPARHSGDSSAQLQIEQASAKNKVDEIMRLWQLRRPYDAAAYQVQIKALWRDAYQRAGIQPGVVLGQIANLESLQRLNRILAQAEAQTRTSHGTH